MNKLHSSQKENVLNPTVADDVVYLAKEAAGFLKNHYVDDRQQRRLQEAKQRWPHLFSLLEAI